MDLVDHGKGYFLITCDGAAELRLLAHRAGLVIATRDVLGSGRVRYQSGLVTLETVASCRSYTEYEACGGNQHCGLYLTRYFRVMPHNENEFKALAAVCTPGWHRRQAPPKWRVGLTCQHLNGQDLPPYAKHLINIAQEKWPSKQIVLS